MMSVKMGPQMWQGCVLVNIARICQTNRRKLKQVLLVDLDSGHYPTALAVLHLPLTRSPVCDHQP
jgi:hypothetical protein